MHEMMPRGLITLNNNLLSVVDTETTGLIDGYHDLVQVAVVPLDENLDPLGSPFYMNIRPEFPERATKEAMKKNGLKMEDLLLSPSRWDAADMFDQYFEDLRLPRGKRIAFLTHNGPHDIPFVKSWLGAAAFAKYFHYQSRDSMYLATGYNDAAAFKCRPIPFPDIGLKPLCKKFGILLDQHHDALADCVATAQVYRELLRWDG